MSREKKFNTKYSPEFKIAVIMDMRENHLSYRETARKYNIGSNESLYGRSNGNSAQMGAHILGRRGGRTHGRTSREEKHGQTEETTFE